MFLPLPLLAGLLVVAINGELLPTLPGAATLARVLPALAMLLLPTILAMAALRSVRRALLTGRDGAIPPRALLRLSAAGVPLVVHGLWFFGAYGDLVDQLAQDSHLGRMVLSTLPVFLAELPRLGWSTLAATTCEIHDEIGRAGPLDASLLPRRHDVAAFVRMRVGGPLLVALPLLLLGASLDLLQLHRELYVFVLVTTPGLTLGSLAFLTLVVGLLPFWFRIAFGVAPLPEPPGEQLRAAARALGFPPHRLHVLPTGLRALNAMLVGPLPIGRSLCLTDGLLRELDADSLTGVVAHEVGHARRGHPALLLALVVVVPLLLLAPLRLAEFESIDPLLQAVLLVAGFVVAWTVVRALAHRFEHEADVASVQALGAGPCTRALMVVSRLALPVPHGFFGRVFSLHPDEPARFQVMRRYEGEPAFRERFDARGRTLRRGVLLVLLVAAAAGAWACLREWPLERVLFHLHAGHHAEALQRAAEVGEVPERWRTAWRHVEEDLAVVREIAPTASDWPTAAEALAGPAWQRGEAVLLATGPAAARPWFAMALGAMTEATVFQQALLAYCEAAAEHDPLRMADLAATMRRLGVPPRLAKVFAE